MTSVAGADVSSDTERYRSDVVSGADRRPSRDEQDESS
jgi:hypothetical protein